MWPDFALGTGNAAEPPLSKALLYNTSTRACIKPCCEKRIIIGSDRRPETKQGKIVRFRWGRFRVRDSDHQSEPNTVREKNYSQCYTVENTVNTATI